MKQTEIGNYILFEEPYLIFTPNAVGRMRLALDEFKADVCSPLCQKTHSKHGIFQRNIIMEGWSKGLFTPWCFMIRKDLYKGETPTMESLKEYKHILVCSAVVHNKKAQ